jgi:hypothetical protein
MFYLSLPVLIPDIRYFLNRICIPDRRSKQNKNSIVPVADLNAIPSGHSVIAAIPDEDIRSRPGSDTAADQLLDRMIH